MTRFGGWYKPPIMMSCPNHYCGLTLVSDHHGNLGPCPVCCTECKCDKPNPQFEAGGMVWCGDCKAQVRKELCGGCGRQVSRLVDGSGLQPGMPKAVCDACARRARQWEKERERREQVKVGIAREQLEALRRERYLMEAYCEDSGHDSSCLPIIFKLVDEQISRMENIGDAKT